jgi:predicted DNA-binding protein (UPF0251 family)
MPRVKQSRKICQPPIMQGFKPYGIPRCELQSVILHFDEYEALRLVDYEGCMQDEAAERMNVSRPTLTRIYEKARKTMAKALVEGSIIVIEGGNVQFEKQWFRCKKCFKLIGGLENHVPCRNCRSFCIDELTEINKSEER